MERIGNRLAKLEAESRRRAAAEVARAWASLTDDEVALVLAPLHYGREPTPEERAAEEKARSSMPEALIARAIGHGVGMPPQEVSARIRALLDEAGLFQRSGVRRGLEEGRRHERPRSRSGLPRRVPRQRGKTK